MKQISYYALSIFFCISAIGLTAAPKSDGHNIKVKISNLPDTTLFLAYHLGDMQYMQDTIRLDDNGMGEFKGDEPLPGGIYLVVLPSRNYFEIIVREQNFYIENDTMDMINRFKSSGSVENKVFYEDLRFLNEKQQQKQQLDAQIAAAIDDEEKNELKAILAGLGDEVKSFRKKIQEEYPDLLYTKILKMMEEVDVPEAPTDEEGNVIDSTFRFRFYKYHYFDNVDFSEESILRTPIYHNKIKYYIEKLTSPVPDSIIVGCHYLIDRAEANDEVFKYTVIYLLNKYAGSKMMGMDAVYVDLVESVYESGKAFWVDSSSLWRIVSTKDDIKPLLIGKKAPNMFLKDVDKRSIPLYSVEAKYTLIFIYSPDCGHCKKETPKFVKACNYIVDTMGLDLKVYAAPTMHLHTGEYDSITGRPIYSDDPKDLKEWLNFIKEFKIEKWINVADLYLNDYFREKYDVSSTPKVFLLDKNKKIIAKRISGDQLVEFLKNYEEIAKKKGGS